MNKLVDLLKDLGADSSLATEYEKDPDAVLSRYTLSDEEISALKARDLEKIKQLSGLSDVHLTNTTVNSHD